MSVIRFLDTNILLYAYDIESPSKRAIALSFVEEGWESSSQTVISVQVLQELQVNLVKRGLSQKNANDIVRDFSGWTVVDNDLGLLLRALELQTRWKTSLWDALILAAAHQAGASELITEDLNHGQDYGGVKVLNPFRS
jgi:predicted nucleic acid-binding protein